MSIRSVPPPETATYNDSYALHDVGRSFAAAAVQRARKLSGHIWSGLTALGSSAADAAKGHIATFANHVAVAHNEVVKTLVSNPRNPNATIHKHHFLHHQKMTDMIHKHVAEIVVSHGLLAGGKSANYIVVAADRAAQGVHIDNILDNNDASQNVSIVTATHNYVKNHDPPNHAGHRAANVQAATSAAILNATVASAEHADARHA